MGKHSKHKQHRSRDGKRTHENAEINTNPAFHVSKKRRLDSPMHQSTTVVNGGDNDLNNSTRKKKPRKVTDFDLITKHDYVIDGDMMYVRPYIFEFTSYFKPRWAKCKVFDVFQREFRHVSSGYWEDEFANGRVLCNRKPIKKEDNVVWQEGMELIHLVHRHESAVFCKNIEIVHNDPGFMVVSKPSSMPVHPCGTYRRNCLQFILRAFYNCNHPLHCIHRLDKETSGLIILAKDTANAARFSDEIKCRRVKKIYLAQVDGRFPTNVSSCDEKLYWDKTEMKCYVNSEKGVEAKTEFKLISYNSKRDTSIVQCHPITGRSHQIRVHLAFLGFPIVNDQMYNTLNRPYKLARNSTSSTISARLDSPTFQDTPESLDEKTRPTLQLSTWSKQFSDNSAGSDTKRLCALEEGKLLECANCPQVTNVKNVDIDKMVFHLHALKYESEEWSFEVSPPEWISDDNNDGYNDTAATDSTKSNKWRMCSIS